MHETKTALIKAGPKHHNGKKYSGGMFMNIGPWNEFQSWAFLEDEQKTSTSEHTPSLFYELFKDENADIKHFYYLWKRYNMSRRRPYTEKQRAILEQWNSRYFLMSDEVKYDVLDMYNHIIDKEAGFEYGKGLFCTVSISPVDHELIHGLLNDYNVEKE